MLRRAFKIKVNYNDRFLHKEIKRMLDYGIGS